MKQRKNRKTQNRKNQRKTKKNQHSFRKTKKRIRKGGTNKVNLARDKALAQYQAVKRTAPTGLSGVEAMREAESALIDAGGIPQTEWGRTYYSIKRRVLLNSAGVRLEPLPMPPVKYTSVK